MTPKKIVKTLGDMNLDNIAAEVDPVIKSRVISKSVRPVGRPKLNPHAQEKKMSIRMPAELHRQLRLASADTGRPMTEIAVDALIKHLKKYERK